MLDRKPGEPLFDLYPPDSSSQDAKAVFGLLIPALMIVAGIVVLIVWLFAK